MSPSGKILGFYEKVRLVPFGENLTFYEFLPEFIGEIELQKEFLSDKLR
ncbi:MAG: hypothetical protein ACO2O5_11615 [Candidatus Caldipriscus sp.]